MPGAGAVFLPIFVLREIDRSMIYLLKESFLFFILRLHSRPKAAARCGDVRCLLSRFVWDHNIWRVIFWNLIVMTAGNDCTACDSPNEVLIFPYFRLYFFCTYIPVLVYSSFSCFCSSLNRCANYSTLIPCTAVVPEVHARTVDAAVVNQG